MTKKHFEMMARGFKEKLDTTKDLKIRDGIKLSVTLFMTMAAEFNDKFDKSRFLKACGL
jgi:hypothetical protein